MKTIANTVHTRRILAAGFATAFLMLAAPVSAADQGHTLVVDGVSYDSYKHSGDAIHWETPDVEPLEASFAERDQTWTGHGSEHLPCPGGIHWISNENVLTVSHCLEEYPPSTTSTSLPDTTSTTAPTSTTTVPASSSSTLAPTTTARETTSTLSPTTSTSSSLAPTSSSSSVPTTPPGSTVNPTPREPGNPIALATTTTTPTGTTPLPKTGSDWILWAVVSAILAVGFGWMIRFGARRP